MTVLFHFRNSNENRRISVSLRFYFGPSDGGTGKKLYEEIIRRSLESPRQNFLVLVPDQFTMQTQKELVTMH